MSDASQLVKDMLAEYGALARARLGEVLANATDPGSQAAPLYELASDYPERGGRMLRPTICMATARAFGASLDDALNTAVSLELMHNAFLVHDDIEDDGEERRGRPTLHRLHGVPIAINVGDALAVMSLRPLMDNFSRLGPRVAMRVMQETERMARESVEGQAVELEWRERNRGDLQEADYLRMVLQKTCWYTSIFPTRVGALIGTRDGIALDQLLRFGFFLGAAFQIQDDLLNLVGDHAQYGKELDGDIYEGKRTLMIIHLLRYADEDTRATVLKVLGKARAGRTLQEVTTVRAEMDRWGSIEFGQRYAHRLAGAATREFDHAFRRCAPSRDLEFVRALPNWVLARA